MSRLWFAPGQADAARHLWEPVRWEWRERASNLLLNFDARSPLAVHAPVTIDEGRPTAVMV